MRTKTRAAEGSNLFCFNIRSSSHEAIKLLAFAEERTVTEVLNDMLADYCRRHEKKLKKLAEAKEEMRKTLEEG